MGYELSPVDLTCRRDRLLPEVIQMVALLLKGSVDPYQYVERWGAKGWSATVDDKGSSRRVYASPLTSSSKSSPPAQAEPWMWEWWISLVDSTERDIERDMTRLERPLWLSHLETLLKVEASVYINDERPPLSPALIRALEESLTVTFKER